MQATTDHSNWLVERGTLLSVVKMFDGSVYVPPHFATSHLRGVEVSTVPHGTQHRTQVKLDLESVLTRGSKKQHMTVAATVPLESAGELETWAYGSGLWPESWADLPAKIRVATAKDLGAEKAKVAFLVACLVSPGAFAAAMREYGVLGKPLQVLLYDFTAAPSFEYPWRTTWPVQSVRPAFYDGQEYLVPGKIVGLSGKPCFVPKG